MKNNSGKVPEVYQETHMADFKKELDALDKAIAASNEEPEKQTELAAKKKILLDKILTDGFTEHFGDEAEVNQPEISTEDNPNYNIAA